MMALARELWWPCLLGWNQVAGLSGIVMMVFKLLREDLWWPCLLWPDYLAVYRGGTMKSLSSLAELWRLFQSWRNYYISIALSTMVGHCSLSSVVYCSRTMVPSLSNVEKQWWPCSLCRSYGCLLFCRNIMTLPTLAELRCACLLWHNYDDSVHSRETMMALSSVEETWWPCLLWQN
jgi:hypothetical protein